ncbi:hypothetical protein, partial [Bacillus altitudinis]|uniref:hypothetical protein n=1 Tax=Bacillus altitudinis TaxID=293387 RepID=UPI001C92FB8C
MFWSVKKRRGVRIVGRKMRSERFLVRVYLGCGKGVWCGGLCFDIEGRRGVMLNFGREVWDMEDGGIV